jgi:hypothetical protein
MAKAHGSNSALSLADAGAVVRDLGIFCDSIELDRSKGVADSTTIGLDDMTYLAGLKGGSLSLGGKWDSLVTSGPDVLLSGLLGFDTATAFVYGPEGSTAGMVKYSGSCLIEKYQVSSPLEGVVKWSATLRVTGAVTRGAY